MLPCTLAGLACKVLPRTHAGLAGCRHAKAACKGVSADGVCVCVCVCVPRTKPLVRHELPQRHGAQHYLARAQDLWAAPRAVNQHGLPALVVWWCWPGPVPCQAAAATGAATAEATGGAAAA